MSERRASDIVWDPADPDPWLALQMDRSLPFDAGAKADLIRDQRRWSAIVLLSIVRPFARAMILVAWFVHLLTGRLIHAPRLLHRLIGFGMHHFLTPEANRMILRHFHLGAQVLRFIADNATPGFRPSLEPMAPRRPWDVADNLFLKHDLNIFNFLIQLNKELDRRGAVIAPRAEVDFSAIEEEVALEAMPQGRFNFVDLHTAIEMYTPLYALLLTQRDFDRAAHSLQLDETIGLYAARLTGEEKHLAMINNRHPLIPHSNFRAGYRLMLHGLSTEVLHGFLRELKARQQFQPCHSRESGNPASPAVEEVSWTPAFAGVTENEQSSGGGRSAAA
jgi:hypothetical protein